MASHVNSELSVVYFKVLKLQFSTAIMNIKGPETLCSLSLEFLLTKNPRLKQKRIEFVTCYYLVFKCVF
jgi:hypothetical protein